MTLEERVARALCQQWGDDWQQGRKFHTANAAEITAIVVEHIAKQVECDCCDVCGESPGYPKCAYDIAAAIRALGDA